MTDSFIHMVSLDVEFDVVDGHFKSNGELVLRVVIGHLSSNYRECLRSSLDR